MSSTKEEVHKVIGQLQKEGIENILALRGDIPQDGQFPLPGQYSHACELIEDIKKMGDFCIGAACYPEGHVEMEHKKDDIRYLKEKVVVEWILLPHRCFSIMIFSIISCIVSVNRES